MAADSATPEEGRSGGGGGGGGGGRGGGGGNDGSKDDTVLDHMPCLHVNAIVTSMSTIPVNFPVVRPFIHNI